MKKETPIIPKIPKREQGEQLHLDIKIPNKQVEIDSVLTEGEVIMSSDDKEHTIPKIITTQDIKMMRKKREETKKNSLDQIKKFF
jgi:hypothetical protein